MYTQHNIGRKIRIYSQKLGARRQKGHRSLGTGCVPAIPQNPRCRI